MRFPVVADTIAWERWEGTIEYALIALVRRSLHLIGTCSYAATYSVIRALLIFGVDVLPGWLQVLARPARDAPAG